MPKYRKITQGKNKGKYKSLGPSGAIRSKKQIAAIAIAKKARGKGR